MSTSSLYQTLLQLKLGNTSPVTLMILHQGRTSEINRPTAASNVFFANIYEAGIIRSG